MGMTCKAQGGGVYTLTINEYDKELLYQLLYGATLNTVDFIGLPESEQKELYRKKLEYLGHPIPENANKIISEMIDVYKFANEWLQELNQGFTVIPLESSSSNSDQKEDRFDIEVIKINKKQSSEWQKLNEEESNNFISRCISKTMEKRNHDAMTTSACGDHLVWVVKYAKENKLFVYRSIEWIREEIFYKIHKIN